MFCILVLPENGPFGFLISFYFSFWVGKAPPLLVWGIPKGGKKIIPPAGHGAGTKRPQKLNARKTLEHQYMTRDCTFLERGHTRHRQLLAMTDPKHIITRGQTIARKSKKQQRICIRSKLTKLCLQASASSSFNITGKYDTPHAY